MKVTDKYHRHNSLKIYKNVINYNSLQQGYYSRQNKQIWGWTTEEIRFDPWQGKEVNTFFQNSLPAVTLCPIHWVTRNASLKVQAASRMKLTTPSHLMLRCRMFESIPLFPPYNSLRRRNISLLLLFLSLYVPVMSK